MQQLPAVLDGEKLSLRQIGFGALPVSAAMMGSKEFNEPRAVDAHFGRTWDWLLNGVAAQHRS